MLSQWKRHCHALAQRLQSRDISPLILEGGGLGKRARAALLARIESTPRDDPLVVIATGQFLGEGFDCPHLDTLFLAFPISFKGRLVQYTGRPWGTKTLSEGQESLCRSQQVSVPRAQVT